MDPKKLRHLIFLMQNIDKNWKQISNLSPKNQVCFKRSGGKKHYRSGMVNSKSFVSKVLLRIKWKFELN